MTLKLFQLENLFRLVYFCQMLSLPAETENPHDSSQAFASPTCRRLCPGR